jgi:RHS repeat-associated protein
MRRGARDAVARLRLAGNGSGGVAAGSTQEVAFQLTDAQFSVIAVATPGKPGVVIDRIAYSAYGEATRTLRSDVNGDGFVNKDDYNGVIRSRLNTTIGSSGYVVEADLDRDGKVAQSDYDIAIADDGKSSSGGVGEAGLFAKGVRNGVGYCGYMFNDESGLYTVRFRSYSPTLGRWLERDPAGYVDGMGLYEYVRGQPILMLDPEGLSPLSWLLKKGCMAVAKSSIKSAIRDMVENRLKKILKGRIRDSAKEKEIKELLELAEEIEEAVETSGGSLLWNLWTMVPIAGDACDLIDTCRTIAKVRDKLEELDRRYDRVVKRLRDKGVRDAWARERERLAAGRKGSRDWTDAQRKDIIEGRRPKGRDGRTIEGHHRRPVEEHPDLADDPDNIDFLDWTDHLDVHGRSPRS